MANNADVTVKNVFSDNVTVNVKRRLQNGTIDQEVDIAQDEAKQVHLPSTEVALVVTVPEGMNLRDCFLKVKTDVDVETIHSRTEGNWTLKIIPNDIPPDAPTTMNVTVGRDEPD
jgi:hypothetical protein